MAMQATHTPIIPEAGPFVASDLLEKRANISSKLAKTLESERLLCIPYVDANGDDSEGKQYVAGLHAAQSGEAQPWSDAYDQDACLWRWMATSWHPYKDVEDFRERYIRVLPLAGGSRKMFVLVDPRHTADATSGPKGRAVGVACLMRDAPDHLAIEIGHVWITPAYQGTYVLPQLVLLFADHVFSLGYRRLTWSCNALNDRSARAAQRLGFVCEGQFRLWAVNAAGESRDTKWFSMVRDEWEGGDVREALEMQAQTTSDVHKDIPPPPQSCKVVASPLPAEVMERTRTLKPESCQQTLEGRFVRLDVMDIDRDCAELFLACNGSAQFGASEYDPDAIMWRFLFQHPPQKVEDYINTCQGLLKTTQPFTISDVATNRKIGVITVCNNVPEMLRAELGNIWITPAYQGDVALPEATLLLVNHLFALGYRRVEWKCDARNKRSQDAAKRMGFIPEAVFRCHMIIKDRSRDTAWFSIAGDSEHAEAQKLLESTIERRLARRGAK